MKAPAELDLKALEVTDAQLAKLLDVSARRVRQLAEQGTLERVAPGRFCLGDAVQALIDQAGGNGNEFQKQRTRKMTADADRAELELAKAAGEVGSIEGFKYATSALMTMIQVNVMQVPNRAVLQLLGCTNEATFKAKLREELILALKTAAETPIDPPEDLEDLEDEQND